MNRWLALAIAIIGGAIAGYAVLIAVGGAVAGFLWLYVFGDDPWPAWSDYVLGAAIIAGGLAAWAYCGWAIRRMWRGLMVGFAHAGQKTDDISWSRALVADLETALRL